jgi:hypothetical protein
MTSKQEPGRGECKCNGDRQESEADSEEAAGVTVLATKTEPRDPLHNAPHLSLVCQEPRTAGITGDLRLGSAHLPVHTSLCAALNFWLMPTCGLPLTV